MTAVNNKVPDRATYVYCCLINTVEALLQSLSDVLEITVWGLWWLNQYRQWSAERAKYQGLTVSSSKDFQTQNSRGSLPKLRGRSVRLAIRLQLVPRLKCVNYTSTPPDIFMAWRLIKHRDNFTVYLRNQTEWVCYTFVFYARAVNAGIRVFCVKRTCSSMGRL